MDNFSLDWLLPLEEEDQFVGGLKNDLEEGNSIKGTSLNYEGGDLKGVNPIEGELS